ncbi:type IV secretion system DNA-binding domain-containing protein [Paremcibacter congregatus]|uniref:type IV secretion system DNA-binding domain-containing protein n=1 Tax=Paremcibacter congregatus TaxID=2043170 RepID=UPI0030ED7A5F|tara:strand:- start:1473 stop:3296 length:1824 start_codon:yes stop_codon:yes gene_type:complete
MIRKLKIILFLITCLGFAGAAGLYHLGFTAFPTSGSYPNGQIATFAPDQVKACLIDRLYGLIGDDYGQRSWTHCAQQLDKLQALGDLNLRLYAVMSFAGLGGAALFLFALVLRFEQPPAKVLRGPRLLAGRGHLRRLAKACRKECKVSGPGIELLPRITLSRDRETLHHLIWGSVGGGKTQTMLRYILAAYHRGDSLLVLDTKGDMMSNLPGDPILIAPHDKRSLVWDVAADCRTRQDARELAARFIPESHDQMWSNAAREIFVACIVYLQATRDEEWTWRDLHKVVTLDIAELTKIARQYHGDALRNLSPPDSKTTHSTLATFQAHMTTVATFAEAWGDASQGKFSIHAWLHNPPSFRPVILQHDPAYADLSRIWVGSMVSFLASMVGSPRLTESKRRRIWLFLDEFPQLHPIRNFASLIELGRSKGVISVIGVQDLAQLRATYGREQAGAWPGMIGTKIITRINMSASAEEASQMIGDQEVERRVKNVSRSGQQTNVSITRHRERRRVMTAAEIADDLGPHKKGVRVLLMGIGKDIHTVDLPYITLDKQRPGTLPADWTTHPPQKSEAARDNDTAPQAARLSEHQARDIKSVRPRALKTNRRDQG